MKPFLTAEWRNLILLTYAVEPSALTSYLPDGLQLDMRNNQAFVSFVAFEFLHTRVKGLPVPFHINFPEINLRFYLKKGDTRGVMFIKELVPKSCIALVARKLYNEPYEHTPMTAKAHIQHENRVVEHHFEYKKQPQMIRVIADNRPFLPKDDSTEAFFKEHEWGFGVDKKGRLLQYRVEHPKWRIYPLRPGYTLQVDFGLLYGQQWNFLSTKTPYSALLAEGSPIKVFPGELI